MKRETIILSLLLSLQTMVSAQEIKPVSFDAYLTSFDYQARKDMKISSKEMLTLVSQNKAQLIDIRFKEEYAAWHMPVSKNIPLNELPKRLNELDKDKLIITACPHNDRANLARIYLMLKGYHVKYLSDGLLKTMESLRGDNAYKFIKESNEYK